MLAKVSIVNYDSRIAIYSFIVLATVIMIVNYDLKTFIVQATGVFVLGKLFQPSLMFAGKSL